VRLRKPSPSQAHSKTGATSAVHRTNQPNRVGHQRVRREKRE